MAAGEVWTEDEERVIVSHIKADPSNISAALRVAADELGRSYSACQNRWYNYISKHEDKYHTCFVIMSRRKYAKNRKNVKKDIPEHSNGSMWSKILNFFFD